METTCILSSYGAGPYLKEAVTSVLAQTRPFTEVIVCEDELDLGKYEYPKEWSIVKLPHKCGPSYMRMRGMRKVTKDFVMYLDGDDVLAPNYLADMLPLADNTTMPYGRFDTTWSDSKL